MDHVVDKLTFQSEEFCHFSFILVSALFSILLCSRKDGCGLVKAQLIYDEQLIGFYSYDREMWWGLIGACWHCCCWCCFYVIDDWSWIWCWLQEYAGFRTDSFTSVLLRKAINWLGFFLIDLIFGKLFCLLSYFFINPSWPLGMLIFWSSNRDWYKNSPERDLWCWDGQVERILTCSWCIIGVGPVICWIRWW